VQDFTYGQRAEDVVDLHHVFAEVESIGQRGQIVEGIARGRPIGRWNFEKMSLTYAAAMGSKEVDGMVVP